MKLYIVGLLSIACFGQSVSKPDPGANAPFTQIGAPEENGGSGAAFVPAPKPGQILKAVTATTLPSNWVGVGFGYNPAAIPNGAVTASYATRVADSGPVYSFNSIDITSSRTKPFSTQTAVRTGLATVLKQWGPVSILGFLQGGVSAGTSIGGSFSGGGGAWWVINRSGLTLSVDTHLVKDANSLQRMAYTMMIGRSWQ